MRNRRLATWALTLVLAALVARPAAARGSIKSPGDHPDYVFEAEPHFSVGYAGGFGPGFRGTVVILDNGFIPTLNNSVGIGAGVEWLFYSTDCEGPPQDRVCDRVGDVMVPIVIQWNFWLARHFSVFGEPGIALHFHRGPKGNDFQPDPFTVFGGARVHFSDSVALTLRLGAPQLFHHDSVLSLGVSFLL